MPPLAVHLWAVKTLQLHIFLGCQCKDDKGVGGKLLDLSVLRRLKGLFGWERDKGRSLSPPPPLFFWWLKGFGGPLGRNSCQPSSRTFLLSCWIVCVHRLLPDWTCGLPDKQLEELWVYWSLEGDFYDLEKKNWISKTNPFRIPGSYDSERKAFSEKCCFLAKFLGISLQ